MKQLQHKTGRTTLAHRPKPVRVRRFLQEWANTLEEDAGRLARRYPEFHPPTFKTVRGQETLSIPVNWTESLRDAWRIDDPWGRDMKLGHLMTLAGQAQMNAACQGAGWTENVAMAVASALRLADCGLLGVCGNPECSTPLFIRKRKNQAVCSADCRGWMQRKWQRDWWDAHGKQKRTERREAGKKTKARKSAKGGN